MRAWAGAGRGLGPRRAMRALILGLLGSGLPLLPLVLMTLTAEFSLGVGPGVGARRGGVAEREDDVALGVLDSALVGDVGKAVDGVREWLIVPPTLSRSARPFFPFVTSFPLSSVFRTCSGLAVRRVCVNTHVCGIVVVAIVGRACLRVRTFRLRLG